MSVESIADLVAINIPMDFVFGYEKGRPIKAQDLKWGKAEKDQWFYAETCARHLMVGGRQLIAGLPPEILQYAPPELISGSPTSISPTISDFSHTGQKSNAKNPMVLYAQSAYELLLRFACGLESEKTGEEHVVSQLRDRLKAFDSSKSPARGSVLTNFGHILHDEAFIRDHLGNSLRPYYIARPQPEDAARMIAGIAPGDKVMLIASDQSTTLKAMQALARDNSRQVGEVILVHPDDAKLAERYNEIKRHQATEIEMDDPDSDKSGKTHLLSNKVIITPMNFKTALATKFDTVKYVYVCTDVENKNLSIHTQLKNAWEQRHRRDGCLVLAKGPEVPDECYRLWADPSLNAIKLPDVVYAQFKKELAAYYKVFSKAAQACIIASLSRSAGLVDGDVKELITTFLDAERDVLKPAELAALQQEIAARAGHRGRLREEQAKRGSGGREGPS